MNSELILSYREMQSDLAEAINKALSKGIPACIVCDYLTILYGKVETISLQEQQKAFSELSAKEVADESTDELHET